MQENPQHIESETAAPIHVCLVAPLPPPYGGISHWTKMILDHASQVQNVSLHIIDIATRWRAVHKTASIIRIIGGSLQLIRDLFRLARTLHAKRPSVIHLVTAGEFGLLRDLAIITIAKLKNVPVVYHIRFGRVPKLLRKNWNVEGFLLKLNIYLSQYIISIDRKTHSAILNATKKHESYLIPNCYDPSMIVPTEHNEHLSELSVIFVGWIIPTKGINELIEAWKRVRIKGWQLTLVGPGDPEYIETLMVDNACFNVSFTGELQHTEAMKLVAKSSILVLPSYTEGFPNIILEGMAHGKAIVATSVGAIPEMLEGDAGIVIPPQNTEALAGALRTLMTDHVMRSEFGRKARGKAKACYSVSSIFPKYEAIWRQAGGVCQQ